jgi:hypothetical protein
MGQARIRPAIAQVIADSPASNRFSPPVPFFALPFFALDEVPEFCAMDVSAAGPALSGWELLSAQALPVRAGARGDQAWQSVSLCTG